MSSRLGRPKQLLEWRGRPLLQHVVEVACGAAVDEVVVVLGHRADEISAALSLPPGARTVLNPHFHRGQSSSLRVGLSALAADVDAAAILLGDQPRVTTPLVDRVLAEFRRTGGPVVRPRFGDEPGHPVVVARREWPMWMQLSGDAGAGRLLARSPGVVEVAVGEAPLGDIDTWTDYESLLAQPEAEQ